MKTVIEMAREAGAYPAANTDRALLLLSESHLERFAALVAAAERETLWRDIHDAVVKDSDKAHALLRWAETEMRYAGWGTRINDQHGRTDVYEAIVEFLK